MRRPTSLLLHLLAITNVASWAPTYLSRHDVTLSATNHDTPQSESTARRKALAAALWAPIAAALGISLAAVADDVFVRQTNDFGYRFQPPPGFAAGNKPLKTHLDEVNFSSQTMSGFQFGITVDPVRIESLSDFGTPEQVAAKVVTAEVNRDGVFQVQLVQDPLAGRTSSGIEYYQLDYLSSGKRGDKRFVCKFYIFGSKLYALTAQCKNADYDAVAKDLLLAAVDSFEVL